MQDLKSGNLSMREFARNYALLIETMTESSHNGNAVLLLNVPLDLNNTYYLRETFGEDSDLPPPRRISRTTELIRKFEIEE